MEYLLQQAFYILCLVLIVVSVATMAFGRAAESPASDPNFFPRIVISAVFVLFAAALAAYMVIRERVWFGYGYAILAIAFLVQIGVHLYPKRRRILQSLSRIKD